jgi:hypothetical protein
MQRLFVGRLGRVVWLQRSDSGVLQFACRTLKAVALGAITVTGSGDKASSALMLWSMTDAGKEVVKVP